MKSGALTIYLNDHLAGSVAAIEKIEHLIETHEDAPDQAFFKELLIDIKADQDELRRLMRVLSIEESGLRGAGAWIAEKLTRPKFGAINSRNVAGVGFLQALESLLLGIRGKEALWRALETVALPAPRLKSFAFERLIKRAIDQVELVEAKRLQVISQVF